MIFLIRIVEFAAKVLMRLKTGNVEVLLGTEK